jgi:hypothetical protein
MTAPWPSDHSAIYRSLHLRLAIANDLSQANEQPGMIKQTINLRVYESQIRMVNHDHIAIITWLVTHIIVHRSKRSNFGRSTFKLKI